MPARRKMTIGALIHATAPAVALGLRKLGARLRRDEAGGYAIMTALLMPVLIGFTGMGTEFGLWFYKHRFLQNAADSAAVSGAAAYSLGAGSSEITVQAQAVSASYGFEHGVKNVSVTVNRPPVAGKYKSLSDAIEVIVSEPQAPLFSAFWSRDPIKISVRAVALGSPGTGCVLALNKKVSSAGNAAGGAKVNLNGCSLYDNSDDGTALSVDGSSFISALSVGVVGGISGNGNIATTHGVSTGISPVKDPYAEVSPPPFSGCDHNHYSAHKKKTISPGVYCNGITINAGAVVTMLPGIYFLDRGTLKVNGGATIQGSGVTLVFTSSTGKNWADATINGGATVDLTAPTSGATAGITIYGDRNMPAGTSFDFNGGASQYLGGAVYLPKGAINYAGGASSKAGCTQLIGDTIKFSGDSNLAIDCKGSGVKSLGVAATLVE